MCLYGRIAANKHIRRSKISPLCKSNKLVGRCNIHQMADGILKEREREGISYSLIFKNIYLKFISNILLLLIEIKSLAVFGIVSRIHIQFIY